MSCANIQGSLCLSLDMAGRAGVRLPRCPVVPVYHHRVEKLRGCALAVGDCAIVEHNSAKHDDAFVVIWLYRECFGPGDLLLH